MLSEPLFLILALCIVTLGTALQGLIGFGMAIVAAPLLILIDPGYLPGPILFFGLLLSIFNTLRYRYQINWLNVKVALLGRALGSMLAIYVLSLLPRTFFSIGFAIIIIASVLLTYRQIKIPYSQHSLFIGGFFSGLMGTTTSIGGPPIALVYQYRHPTQARSELGLFFLVGTVISLLLLVLSGHYSYTQWQLTVPLLPAVAIGFIASVFLDKHFKAHYLKPVASLLSLIAGLIVLTKAILALN